MKINYSVKTVLRTDKKKLDGTCPLYYQIIVNSKTLKLPVGESLKVSEWDFGKNLPNRNYRGKEGLTEFLEKEVQGFKDFIVQRKRDSIGVTMQDLKSFANGELEKDFYHYFDEFTKKKFEKIRKGTQAHYKLLRRQLKEFNPSFNISALNYEFVTDFFYYLEVTKKVGASGRATRRKNLITVIEEFIKLGLMDANPCKQIKKPKENMVDVFLTKSELESLVNLDMCFGKKNNGLIITKDLFLFSCYTGLRFGDVISLNKKEVEKDRIVKEMEKVSKKIEIPLIPEAKLILEKYGYKFTDGYIFPYRSNVSMNRDLKFIANELKIDKKLTFHIARHTFGSILGMNKVSPFNIMKLMGHGDVRMTSRYVNTNSKILEGVMKEVSF